MIIKVLRVALYGKPIGQLFVYADLCRFVAIPGLGADVLEPTLSLSMKALDPQAQMALWADVKSPSFNVQGGRLPAFFQNLLPEDVLRKHIASLRGCAENDYFELLAACGGDLPGAVTVWYEETSVHQIQRLVTQDQDSLEVSVIEMPLAEAISISGVQPKLALVCSGQRYVHRTRNGDGVRIIAKLPVVSQPFMPLLEKTALDLAQAAGVTVCHAKLAPLSAIDAQHSYQLPNESDFLAITRFDRHGAIHLHFEDFAQILGVDPSAKYTSSYLEMVMVMMGQPSLGEQAALELVRRLVVNELLGNPDAHLKNFGVLYVQSPDGPQPVLAPAFDIVPYAIFQGIEGHALPLIPGRRAKKLEGIRKLDLFTPASVREFSTLAGLQEYKVRLTIQETCIKARVTWPMLISNSGLPAEWIAKLQERLTNHPLARAVSRSK